LAIGPAYLSVGRLAQPWGPPLEAAVLSRKLSSMGNARLAAIARREFMLGAGAGLLSACSFMRQIESTEHVLATPPRAAYRPVLGALITSILPFEHPRFPAVLTPSQLEGVLLELFPLGADPELADVPPALMLFDDCPLFDATFPPFVDAQREAGEDETSAAEHDRVAFAAYRARFGDQRFALQSLSARRAYLVLWSQSGWIARRRIYRGYKALVTISAYSTRAMWETIGYDGPWLEG
jgi:hypothetical protein